jgi:hypothetical protein
MEEAFVSVASPLKVKVTENRVWGVGNPIITAVFIYLDHSRDVACSVSTGF